MLQGNHPKLIFTAEFNERAAFEAEARGYWGHSVVELPEGPRVAVCFYDAVRLSQDLETVQEAGEVCIAEPGLIVLPKVTRDYMERAVKQLYEQGYFRRLLNIRKNG